MRFWLIFGHTHTHEYTRVPHIGKLFLRLAQPATQNIGLVLLWYFWAEKKNVAYFCQSIIYSAGMKREVRKQWNLHFVLLLSVYSRI